MSLTSQDNRQAEKLVVKSGLVSQLQPTVKTVGNRMSQVRHTHTHRRRD